MSSLRLFIHCTKLSLKKVKINFYFIYSVRVFISWNPSLPTIDNFIFLVLCQFDIYRQSINLYSCQELHFFVRSQVYPISIKLISAISRLSSSTAATQLPNCTSYDFPPIYSLHQSSSSLHLIHTTSYHIIITCCVLGNAQCFTSVNSFNPHNDLIRKVLCCCSVSL